MTTLEPKALIEKYEKELESTDGLIVSEVWKSQYDDYSAAINYCMVREIQPKVIVEFGARTGRCSYDIYRALLKNGAEFNFKTYEKDTSLRLDAQRRLDEKFGKGALIVGGDILKAKGLPKEIDYLFVDNSHDGPTTKWLFKTLLPRCKPGAIVQIHDIPLNRDFTLSKDSGVFTETHEIIKLHKKGKLPLEMLYCASFDTQWESSWWRYTPL